MNEYLAWDELAYKQSCFGGKINPSLLSLKYLNYLDLSYNDFDGIHIPKFFGELKSLRYLNISFASFSREIPPSLGNLSKLNYLHLGDSSFYDSSLEMQSTNLNWLSHLSSLKYLNLNKVDLSSTGVINWLHAVNMLPSLLELHLSHCGIESLPLSLQKINFTSLSVLDLSVNSFNTSSFPNWLFNLTSLRKLDLSGNSFHGPFPSKLTSLKSLEYLDLSNLGLEGQFPKVIGKLCNLKMLSLSGNDFPGEGIEEFLRCLSNCPNNTVVESLDFSYCSLEGQLPACLGMLTTLQHLKLVVNLFWGSIPKSIGNLSSLKTMDLYNNHMNGSISESLGKLSELVKLDLGENPLKDILTEAHFINLTRLKYLSIYSYDIGNPMSLIFNMSYDWVPHFKLQGIEIANCPIGPGFGLWLQSQTELSSVTLRNTSISDSIPEKWFLKISSQLQYLDLSYNQIFGKLPFHLKFPHISDINLGHNQFDGPLPLWTTSASSFDLGSNLFSGSISSNFDQEMPLLRELFLSGNRLNGTLPPSICNIEYLAIVSLSYNQLFGQIPQEWSLCSRLEVIDVAHNNLSGNILSSMGSLTSLQVLKVNNNNFGGEIPFSLQHCTFLRILHLGGNKFTGKLPFWIGSNVSTLQLLSLQSNLLSGHIPHQFCNLPYLHVLDLGHNKFSGTIPKCLKNMTSLAQADAEKYFLDEFIEYDYSPYAQTTITSKGKELEYGDVKLIQWGNIIDLSSNNFEGEIPEQVGSLVPLSTLNLSMNQLTGEIPSSIGKLRWLETLDLSQNHLSGHIPQNFSSLTSLSHLNLSYNNLIGRIPSGNQLETLNNPSIYDGNPSLCGAPLSTICPGDDTHGRNTFHAEDHKKDDNEGFWFYVSMALGFIVGFWAVCGTLVLKKSWRYAYFNFFDNLKEKVALKIALKVARWQGKLCTKRK